MNANNEGFTKNYIFQGFIQSGYVLKLSGHSRISLVLFGNVLLTQKCKTTETESRIVQVKRISNWLKLNDL